jgi:hypothetical protein
MNGLDQLRNGQLLYKKFASRELLGCETQYQPDCSGNNFNAFW